LACVNVWLAAAAVWAALGPVAELMAVLRKLSERGPVTLLLDCAYLDYTADPAHVREGLDQYAELGEEGRVLVAASLSLALFADLPLPAQSPPSRIGIVVVQGEGAIYRAGQRSEGLAVRVEDEEHRPLAVHKRRPEPHDCHEQPGIGHHAGIPAEPSARQAPDLRNGLVPRSAGR